MPTRGERRARQEREHKAHVEMEERARAAFMERAQGQLQEMVYDIRSGLGLDIHSLYMQDVETIMDLAKVVRRRRKRDERKERGQ